MNIHGANCFVGASHTQRFVFHSFLSLCFLLLLFFELWILLWLLLHFDLGCDACDAVIVVFQFILYGLFHFISLCSRRFIKH